MPVGALFGLAYALTHRKVKLRKTRWRIWMGQIATRRPGALGYLTDTMADIRFWFLWYFAELALSRGVSYLFLAPVRRDIPTGLAKAPSWFIDYYAAGWILVGIACLFTALTRWRNVYLFMFLGVPALTWATAYAIAGGISWVGALLYHSVAGPMVLAGFLRPRIGWRNPPKAEL